MFTEVEKSLRVVKNYSGGNFVEPQNSGYLDVENPSSGEVIGKVPLSTAAEVERTVESAYAAYREWSKFPVARRVAYLFKLYELMRDNEETLARQIVEENGKSMSDAVAEMKRAIENVEVACGMPVLQQGDNIIGSSFEVDGEVIRQPVGVFGMIAPFNFPAMVPFWFIPYALATGNTIVVKPSEQVPLTMQLVAEYVAEVGLPPGVFSIVNGDRVAAEALMEHPKVKGISFVGSTAVARQVVKKCADQGKRFQSMGGAKNHLVVMPDAHIEEVVRNMVTSCYGCAGQRCMAASAIVCVGEEIEQKVIGRFIEASKKILVADPLAPGAADERMVMGPVISARAKERILDLIQDGVDEGATLALDGRELVVKGREGGHFIGPTVFTDVKPGMKIHRTEIFGPVVVILKVASLKEAIEMINEHEYGNGASIYTQSGYHARKFKLEVEAGMIGINIGIPAPVAYLPFGGMKASRFSDIKAQGKAVINFYTEDKIVTERYWAD